MIRMKRTALVKGITYGQLARLAEILDRMEIDYEVEQDTKSAKLVKLTCDENDRTTVLVVLADIRREENR